MFNPQEKLFVLSVCAVLFLGAGLDVALKKYPFLASIINVMENQAIYPKTDINRASWQELTRIPYIGDYTAREIIAYREKQGPFRSLEDLKKVKGIKQKNFERFHAFLRVRP